MSDTPITDAANYMLGSPRALEQRKPEDTVVDSHISRRMESGRAELLAALKQVIAASDRFVRDTNMKHGDLITDAVDKARSTIAKVE